VFAVSLVFAVMFFDVGCSNRPSPKPLAVFSGFAYVGEAPYTQADKPEGRAPQHGQVELPFPKQLNAGKQYIFHHDRPMDNEEFALKTLPETFRSLGLRVTVGPKSPGDLIALYAGGPFFEIEFKDGGYTAYIFNLPCPQLLTAEKHGGPWVGEDYVLAIPAQH
jgi:hypothetical protein